MKEKQGRILFGITAVLMLITIGVTYLTHRMVPFMMDDLWYATLLSEDTPIRTFGDIVKSQVWHYQNWGGRSMTHSILQLTLLAGEAAADVLNVVMTLLLAWMICVVSGFAKKKNFFAFFAACGMIIGLNPNWKMSMFWQAGAANYLYITVFILAFLYCYLREIPEEAQKEPPFSVKPLPGITLWILPLGILAGWSNENMGPAIWLVTLFVMVLLRRERRRIKPWMAVGSLSCLVGSIVMIAAPGNFVRSSQLEENAYGIWWNCFLRGYAQSRAVMDYLFPTLLVLAGALLISKGVLKLQIGRRTLLLLAGALLSWGAMLLSPHYPDRAAFGTMVLLVCAILELVRRTLDQRRDLSFPFWIVSVLVWMRGMYFLGEFLAISWGWIK